MNIRTNAPSSIVWIIAVIAGVLGLLVHFHILSLGIDAFLLEAAGFIILAVATVMRGL